MGLGVWRFELGVSGVRVFASGTQGSGPRGLRFRVQGIFL